MMQDQRSKCENNGIYEALLSNLIDGYAAREDLKQKLSVWQDNISKIVKEIERLGEGDAVAANDYDVDEEEQMKPAAIDTTGGNRIIGRHDTHHVDGNEEGEEEEGDDSDDTAGSNSTKGKSKKKMEKKLFAG